MGLSKAAYLAASALLCSVAAGTIGATTVWADTAAPAQAEADTDKLIEKTADGDQPAVRTVNEKILPLINEAYRDLGKGENARAVKTLSRAVTLDPDSVTARRYLAYALVQSANYSEALKQMQKLSKATTPNPFDWYIFGEAYFGAGAMQHALSCYMQSLSVSPDYHAARGGAVKALAATGSYQKAIEQVDQGNQYAKDKVVKKYYVSLRQGVLDAESYHKDLARLGSPQGLTQAQMDEHSSKPVLINPSVGDE